jgi:hypothetical protein
MRSTTRIIAVGVAAFFALAGAVSTADAGRGGGHGGHGHSGGHMSFKSGGGHGHGHGGKGHSQHYAHGGNWNKNYYSHHHGKYGRYRRGYPWYGVYAYGGGGCGWLYSRAITTGSAYWWDRYYQCTGY